MFLLKAGIALEVCSLLVAHSLTSTNVVIYEADDFPEAFGWTPVPGCFPERSIDNGWLVQVVEVACGGPPGGDQDAYRLDLSAFAGAPTFFIEWRMQTDGDRSEITGTAPAALATSDLFGISYHFTHARDQVRFIRDNRLPLVFADVGASAAHTYRLELDGSEAYAWYIDGLLIDAGLPEGPYPTPTAMIVFRAKPWYMDNTTRWDFIRYGRLPEDGSGDYDSDLVLTLLDHYFVIDCLTKDGPGIFGGPGNAAGPGCRFTDFDLDADVDLFDFAEFQNLFGS
jgi:hypothetical protein